MRATTLSVLAIVAASTTPAWDVGIRYNPSFPCYKVNEVFGPSYFAFGVGVGVPIHRRWTVDVDITIPEMYPQTFFGELPPPDPDEYGLAVIPLAFGPSWHLPVGPIDLYVSGGGVLALRRFRVGPTYSNPPPYGLGLDQPAWQLKVGFYNGVGAGVRFADCWAFGVAPRFFLIYDPQRDDPNIPGNQESGPSNFISVAVGLDYSF